MKINNGFWQDLTTNEIAQLDRKKTIIIFPVGAIEQHGRHLPLDTDCLINRGILTHLIQESSKKTSTCFQILPLQTIGSSSEHLSFPGTLSLEPNTLFQVWLQILQSVLKCGFQKILIINSHGGQNQTVDILAQYFRTHNKTLVVRGNYLNFSLPQNLVSLNEQKYGIHGGEIETSLMLFLQPGAVRRDQLANNSSRFEQRSSNYKQLFTRKNLGCSWNAEDLHPSGVVGNALDASVEKGEKILQHIIDILLETLEDMSQYDPETQI